MRSFAVFDVDGTLIRWQLYHAVADALVKLGYFDKNVFDAVKKSRMLWKERAGQDSFNQYEQELIATYDNLLQSITVAQFNEAASRVFNEYKDQSYTYARKVISELKKKNYLLFAISGSQVELVELIARHYGFDEYVGSHYEQREGKFTGDKLIIKGNQKVKALEKFVKKHSASYKSSYAFGDSESDVGILKVVDNPVAFNPNKKLYTVAKKYSWKIVVERKNVIYELQDHEGKYELA